MLDGNLATPRSASGDPLLAYRLELAALAVARLDQALDNHPLAAAFLYRTRLEAVRRQAAADGLGIDPWQLAATLEGLRLRMDHALRIVDRGAIFAAARAALDLHQWLTAPDFDQEGEVQAAERHLDGAPSTSTLLTAAARMHGWLRDGGARPPIRAALIRFWVQRRLLRLPVPLTAPRALGAAVPEQPAEWVCHFLAALADEARDYHQLLLDLERGWASARAKVTPRRSTSRAPVAVDVLAATPLLSATTLAGAIGISIKSATALLDGFARDGIVVEVTHRSKRRLFGLASLAPLRDGTSAPRRPVPGRGPGRPRLAAPPSPEAGPLPERPAAASPPPRFERPPIDYEGLDAAMAFCEQAIRTTRQRLAARMTSEKLPTRADCQIALNSGHPQTR